MENTYQSIEDGGSSVQGSTEIPIISSSNLWTKFWVTMHCKLVAAHGTLSSNKLLQWRIPDEVPITTETICVPSQANQTQRATLQKSHIAMGISLLLVWWRFSEAADGVEVWKFRQGG
eukprot:GHVO01023122.1.p1 GENE.GHVO01023122.1~~GHVO01023122.1.p1  ORF type:complete len:118 (+),score=9.27 GHVO01023122.1:40-393(+)